MIFILYKIIILIIYRLSAVKMFAGFADAVQFFPIPSINNCQRPKSKVSIVGCSLPHINISMQYDQRYHKINK